MGIAEILAQRRGSDRRELPKVQPSIYTVKKAIPVPPKKILSTATFIILEEQETDSPSEKIITEEFNYKVSSDKYLLPSAWNATFLSVYAILIRNPYQNIKEFRELRNILLGDNVYVLNTFPQLDVELLFSDYMKNLPPRKAIHLHKLYITLGEVHLCVPAMYQQEIMRMIWDREYFPS